MYLTSNQITNIEYFESFCLTTLLQVVKHHLVPAFKTKLYKSKIIKYYIINIIED